MDLSHTWRDWIPKTLKIFLYLIIILAVMVTSVLLFFSWQANRREVKSVTEAAPSTGHFIKANDIEVFVQESGSISGESVVLVHGTGAWSEIWRETINVLSRAGYHTIAIDVPPFGYSEKPNGVLAYSRESQAKRIIGVLDAVGIKHATLVGHSVGARPTIEAALEIPNKVDKLVLVDPALGFQSNADDNPHFEQNDPSWITRLFFGIKPLRNAILETYGTNPLSTKKLFSSFVSQKEAVTDARVKMLQQPLVAKNTTSGYGDWLAYLLVSKDTSLASDFGNFKKLTMPVFIIWGNKDSVTPLWQGKRLQKLIPHSKLTVIDDVGHIPYIENTEKFNSTLLENLNNN